MSGEQTPNPQGSAAGGDKGPTSTADGKARAGAEPSNAPISEAFFEQLSGHINGALNPIMDRLGKLENAINGGNRIRSKGGSDKNSDGQGGGGGDGNSDAMAEELRRVTGELEVLQKSEKARAKAEQASRLKTALKGAIEAGGFARGEIIEELMMPYLRIGQTGTPLYDRDGKVMSIEDALKDRFGKDAAFLKPSSTQGTGLDRSERAASVTVDGKKYTADDLRKLQPGSPEFKKVKQAFLNRQ